MKLYISNGGTGIGINKRYFSLPHLYKPWALILSNVLHFKDTLLFCFRVLRYSDNHKLPKFSLGEGQKRESILGRTRGRDLSDSGSKTYRMHSPPAQSRAGIYIHFLLNSFFVLTLWTTKSLSQPLISVLGVGRQPKAAADNKMEWAWLCSNKTLFMETAFPITEILISYHFHVPWNIIPVLIIFSHLKPKPLSTCGSDETGRERTFRRK